jgi:Rps23 Pro-64 3,4-dihydroxylase Tpa1-like proline 4-hydroxylase
MSFLELCLKQDYASLEVYKTEFQTQSPNHFFHSNFFPDQDAKSILAEWPAAGSPWKTSQPLVDFGVGIKNEINDLDKMGERTRDILKLLQSSEFIRSLEFITGIDNLCPDLSMHGCGLVNTPKNGFLKIHADFNYLERLKKYRRINIVIYLNEEWQKEWKGDINFYSEDLTTTIKSYSPLFNNFIMFRVSDKVFHGYPEPIDCPTGMSRKSINFFYYTDEPDKDQSIHAHKTIWKTNTGDDIPY